MKTITISTTYDVKGWINDTHILTTCGKVVNVKLGRIVNPVLRGSKLSYFIDGKWQNEFKLDTNKVECPF